MPEDSIMDLVNNIEPLYLDAQGLYQKWYNEGDAWSMAEADREALALAAHFAETLGRNYRGRHIRAAADQMMEEFREFKRHREEKRSSEAKEAALVGQWERSSMSPADKEHAKKYERIARVIGIDLLRDLLPVSREKVWKALEQGDKALLTIPLRKWDEAALQIPYLPGRGLSLADKVSALKHVAKWHFA